MNNAKRILALVVACCLSRAASGDITTNLVAHWKLDDKAANTTVVATVGGNGTLNGGDNTSAKRVDGPGDSIPYGMSFNGTDDYVDLTTNNSTLLKNVGAFTLACWMKTSATPTTSAALLFVNNGSAVGSSRASLWVLATTGKSQASARAGDAESIQAKISDSTYNDGAWRHVAMTVNIPGDTITLYVDGSAVSATGTIAFTNSATSDINPLRVAIGGIGSPASNFINGSLADARIYTRALIAGDIGELYDLGTPESSGNGLLKAILLYSSLDRQSRQQSHFDTYGVYSLLP